MNDAYVLIIEDEEGILEELERIAEQAVKRTFPHLQKPMERGKDGILRTQTKDQRISIVGNKSWEHIKESIAEDGDLGKALDQGGARVFAILDYRLPGKNGLDIADLLRVRSRDICIRINTAYQTDELPEGPLWEAISRKGLNSFAKSDSGYQTISGEISLWLRKLSGATSPVDEVLNFLKHEFGTGADNPAVKEALEKAARVALKAGRWNLLISGDYGSGKDFLADLVREAAIRFGNHPHPHDQGRIMDVRCGMLPGENNQANEIKLFGKEDNRERNPPFMPGVFERARNGIAIIEEIGNASTEVQQTLLQVIQRNGFFMRHWGTAQIPVQACTIMTTNKAGNLVPDFRDRLTEHVVLPPIYEHLSDVPLVVNNLLRRVNVQEAGGPKFDMNLAVRNMFTAHRWESMRQLTDSFDETVESARRHYSSVGVQQIQIGTDHFKVATRPDCQPTGVQASNSGSGATSGACQLQPAISQTANAAKQAGSVVTTSQGLTASAVTSARTLKSPVPSLVEFIKRGGHLCVLTEESTQEVEGYLEMGKVGDRRTRSLRQDVDAFTVNVRVAKYDATTDSWGYSDTDPLPITVTELKKSGGEKLHRKYGNYTWSGIWEQVLKGIDRKDELLLGAVVHAAWIQLETSGETLVSAASKLFDPICKEHLGTLRANLSQKQKDAVKKALGYEVMDPKEAKRELMKWHGLSDGSGR